MRIELDIEEAERVLNQQKDQIKVLESELRWALSLLDAHPNRSVREECARIYKQLGIGDGYVGHLRD